MAHINSSKGGIKMVKKGKEDVSLRGMVEISRVNTITGEREVLSHSHNTITISGAQYLLMKLFGLFMDTTHKLPYENIGRDTNLIIPDMNASTGNDRIGVDPANYTVMEENISDKHFVQGFMVGNGGSGEDAITTKNTDYSFTRLRNPIPFQQTQTSLNSSIAGKYLGVLRNGEMSFSKNYFIKKFDSRPHIYHGWYTEDQAWDYIDPVSPNDLGPNAPNGIGKTNRIETYVECDMSVDTLNGDCMSYFDHDGSTQTALINELGLVAWDAEYGNRSIVETLYADKIKPMIDLIFDNNRGDDANTNVIALATEIVTICDSLVVGDETVPLSSYGQTNINAFLTVCEDIMSKAESEITTDVWTGWQNDLSLDTNIEVEAAYNQNGVLLYTTDKFLTYLSANEFNSLTNDEAQRIRLITYYTFASIPLQENWKIAIKYRIYAN